MRRIWSCGFILALTGCVSSGGSSPDAGAYAYVDTLKPHGHARGEAAAQAATRICDAGNSQNIGLPAFDKCMRGRGWRIARIEPSSGSSSSYDAELTKRNEDEANAAEARRDEDVRHDDEAAAAANAAAYSAAAATQP
jgi:hypothetical protein